MTRDCPICEKRSTRLILEQPYLDRNVVQCLRCGLWGASEHTMKLQHHTKLPTHHLIDNDPGLNALPPSWLEARPDIPVVVSSYAHQNSILAEIKRRNLPNPVVVLYDKPVE
jgi:hypothetical protein